MTGASGSLVRKKLISVELPSLKETVLRCDRSWFSTVPHLFWDRTVLTWRKIEIGERALLAGGPIETGQCGPVDVIEGSRIPSDTPGKAPQAQNQPRPAGDERVR
jgi:hypothetical protein